MDSDIYLKLDQLFNSIKINQHNVIFIKETLEMIRELYETIPEEDIKYQLLDIIDLIDSFLMIPTEVERDKKIINEIENAKNLLYSIPTRILNDFQIQLQKTNINDFSIINHDGVNITFAGSFDFCYEVELVFLEVEYICCPNQFRADTFRIATNNEISTLNNFTRGYFEYINRGLVFCMEDRSFGDRYYIIAHGLKVTWGMVYYYHRENLQPGERIAEWFDK
jgi:hypothetical protein